jgi:hypothetical protein
VPKVPQRHQIAKRALSLAALATYLLSPFLLNNLSAIPAGGWSFFLFATVYATLGTAIAAVLAWLNGIL